ncbi:MAG: SufD family Fe-S cluster assembly protein [Candidatus Magasanikbacteria bacterium]|nr:SufD family Fe-S cluster assembly protein [Candidatus Magasanikbacteria bacterium]
MKHITRNTNQFLNIVSGSADVDFVDNKMTVVVSEKDVVIEELVCNEFVEIIIELKKDASLDYIAIQSEAGVNISRTVEVAENAAMRWFDINFSNGQTKISTVTKLIGDGARGETYGLFFASDTDEYDVYHATEHLASHTTSDMKVKGVVGGKGFVNYKGLIRIPEGSSGCEGYQKEDTLLLSKDAKIYAVPDLEIANNDVTCFHGVTTTHMSQEKLFYMQSRGLDTETAEHLVVRAHLGGVLDQLSEQKKETVLLLIDEKFGYGREE